MVNFNEKCYGVLRRVPMGKVTTYSEIARAIGKPGGQRAVGNAMYSNPYAPEVPCHRVVKANGEIGGFASGPGNKIKMLEKEGIVIEEGIVDLKKYFFGLG